MIRSARNSRKNWSTKTYIFSIKKLLPRVISLDTYSYGKYPILYTGGRKIVRSVCHSR